MRGHAESRERMMDEIGGVHEVEAEAGDKWAAGVALGAACDAAGFGYNGPETRDKEIAAYERAVRMRLDALGEQHPATAATLASLGTAYGKQGNYDMAIMLCERALRILKVEQAFLFENWIRSSSRTLTSSRSTAKVMSSLLSKAHPKL